jgi:Lantibiotic dehydratase, N terminus
MSLNLAEPIAVLFKEEQVEERKHLVKVPGGEWSVWRWLGVRAAGFPISEVLSLASTECAEAADSLLEADEQAQLARQGLVLRLKQELKQAGAEERKRLSKAIERVKKRRELEEGGYVEWAEARAIAEKEEEVGVQRGGYERRYEEAVRETSEAIQRFGRSEMFQEAIIWQNRKAFHEGVEPLLRRARGATCSSMRRKEELIGNYMQRYCTKNETIGFFGPVGWGQITSSEEAISVRAGRSLLAARRVYFEQWCIDALASALAADQAMRPWLRAWRYPTIRIEGEYLYQPMEGRRKLSESERMVMRECNGERSGREIAEAVMSSRPEVFESEREVFQLLEEFEQLGFIKFGFEIDVQLYPERDFRLRLEEIGEQEVRERAIEALDGLERHRDEVGKAAGDSRLLDEAMQGLEDYFTRVTGEAATRFEGRTYAGRTLVYEECRRDLELEIGREMIEKLGPAMTVILQSVRWMTSEVARVYEEAFEEIYEELVEGSEDGVVDALDFWLRAQRLIFGRRTSLISAVMKGLQKKWGEVLKLDYRKREERYSSQQLREEVEKAFEARKSGWRAGRYHSPDLMVAARSVEAIRRGEYEMVMGELHVGINTLAAGSFVGQHPKPEELFKAVACDLPQPRVLPVSPKSYPKNTSRTNSMFVSPKDYWLEAGGECSSGLIAKTLPISELVVTRDEHKLVVQTRDGNLLFSVLDLFNEMLNTVTSNSFKMIEGGEHIPRVYIDNLVVSRESWSLPAEDLAFAKEKEAATRFLLARQFRRQMQMPRFVFVKVPVEVKPYFVDFESPLLINLMSKSVRRCVESKEQEARVTISEMLPSVEQTWLPDGEGNVYSSELRLVVLDPAS